MDLIGNIGGLERVMSKGNKVLKGKNNVKVVKKDMKGNAEEGKGKKLLDRAKDVKKFPRFYKGFSYKPIMKGFNLYIEVAKKDNRGKKTLYKVCGDRLLMASSTMPLNMHREYQKVLYKNILGILCNLKWYQLLLYRVGRVFRRK